MMSTFELLEEARKNLVEVESIIDKTAKEWDEKRKYDLSLGIELDYLLVQIGNVAQSARDFKRHMGGQRGHS